MDKKDKMGDNPGINRYLGVMESIIWIDPGQTASQKIASIYVLKIRMWKRAPFLV